MVSMGPRTDCPPAGDAGWRDHDLCFQSSLHLCPSHPASFADWGRYVAAQSVGSAINFALSTGLLWLSDRSVLQIWGAVIVGQRPASA